MEEYLTTVLSSLVAHFQSSALGELLLLWLQSVMGKNNECPSKSNTASVSSPCLRQRDPKAHGNSPKKYLTDIGCIYRISWASPTF